jgi:hypothetical protein
MAPEKKDKLQGIGVGIAIGLSVLIGGKIIDSVLKTDRFDSIEKTQSQILDKITEIRLNYVLKSEYDKDKEIVFRTLTRNNK